MNSPNKPLVRTSFVFEKEFYEIFLATLSDHGVLSFEEVDSARGVEIICYPASQHAAEKLHGAILESVEFKIDCQISPEPDIDWSNEWKKNWKPLRLGAGFLIVPSWEEVPETDADFVLRIDSGMAFGTGTHESTAMCLELLEAYILDYSRDGRSVSSFLDVGCGSGILSLAASKLGVGRVCGIDISPDAVEIANNNASLNSLDNCEFSLRKLSSFVEQFDLVCANILSSTIKELWPDLHSRVAPGGRLVLSGLLARELDSFLDELSISPSSRVIRGEWAAVGVDY
ncbi:hypothetical protein BVY02_01415 [bacterium J17]|nr:hypothetical protein BVY02_01415 [bacterium J17]